MPKNTKDIIPGDINVLLVGDGGTGKSRLAATFPDPYFFDCDKGMASVRDRAVDYDTFKEAAKGQKVSKEQTETLGLYPFATAWPAIIKRLNELGTQMDKGECPYKTIVLDSLTTLSEIAMNHVLSSTSQDQPHQGSYGAQQQYIKRVMNELTAWPVRIVATAHIQKDTNDLTQVVEKLPLLTGKLAGFIGIYFDEVYFMDSVLDPITKASKPIILTKSTPVMRQAKSRWNVPDKTDATFEAISKFFPAVRPAVKMETFKTSPTPMAARAQAPSLNSD